MNFELSEEQTALSELAAQIFAGMVDNDRVVQIEATDERFDRELWSELAKAGLIGVAVSEANGGLGFGLTEASLVAQQQGRVVAPIPLWSTIAGARCIEMAGSDHQKQRWLSGVCDGSTVIAVCPAEYGANDPQCSSVSATHTGDRWALTGSKPAVAAAAVADAFIVPAQTDEGLAVFIVPAGTDGLEITLGETTNRELHATLTFDVTLDEEALLGPVGAGAAIVDGLVGATLILHAAISLGCCEAALEMAAAYTSEREQFGRPLSTNQGVALRAASCYIDIECMRVTLQKAAWLVDDGQGASDAIKVARYWASEAAQEVVHNTQHLHGGMGADIDYPVHRTFLWVKQLETAMGGGSRHLAELGESIAADAKESSNA